MKEVDHTHRFRRFHHVLSGTAAHHQHHHHPPATHLPWFVRASERFPKLVRELLVAFVHYLELAAIACAVLLALAVAGSVVRLLLRRRSAERSVRLRVLLPEAFDREGLVGFFRTLSSLLRARLGASSWVALTLSAEGQRLEVELCCAGVFPAQVVSALAAAIHGVSVERWTSGPEQAQRRRRWARCVLRPAGSVWLPLRDQHRQDPSAQVLAALQAHAAGESACVQLVFSPLPRRARTRARKEAWALRGGRRGGAWASLAAFGRSVANELLDFATPGPSAPRTSAPAPVIRSDPWAIEQATAIGRKAAEPVLELTARLATGAAQRRWARERLSGLAASFTQFHELGGLRPGREFRLARRFDRR